MQVYESKLQELQKQVETCSLAVETPDEEEDEEEEEEGAFFFQSWNRTRNIISLLFMNQGPYSSSISE